MIVKHRNKYYKSKPEIETEMCKGCSFFNQHSQAKCMQFIKNASSVGSCEGIIWSLNNIITTFESL